MKKSYSRREFFKRNSLFGAGAFMGLGMSGSLYADSSSSSYNSPGKKIFPVPDFFGGAEDLPSDVFGDLCLMRKGGASMTMGSGQTTIEPIVTREEWSVKANALRKLFNMTLGTRPSGIDSPLSIRVEDETEREDIIERRVSYLLSPGERVYSIMLIPKGVTLPGPALMTIHPTTEFGKEQTVGRGDTEGGELTPAAYRRAYGLHLAERGYITFSPDLLGAGERIYPGRRSFDNQPFIDAHPEWSGSGKDLWDLQRAIDVMQTFSEIDPYRIGSIGHSQGAGLTCYLSAVDKRIKVGVANCGAYPLRVSHNPFNAARTGWWTGRPALRPFMLAGKLIPVDVHELLALSAPRPFLNIIALNDVGFGIDDEPLTRPVWENLRYNVKKIYALYRAEGKFDNIMHLEGHDFHDEMRNRAFAFIDKHL